MTLKEQLTLLPEAPGCYLMKNAAGQIIYVGKAKNLKNRVRSYFVGSHNDKTTRLVLNIASFDYIITDSELESLLLEINLIKEHHPKYNIRFTDDKTYPYIVLTNEEHPRLIVSRNLDQDKGKRFGPYPNVLAARETTALLNTIYPLRKCDTMPKKACLYYHIKQCHAPCIHKDPIDYTPYIKAITAFLKGDVKTVVDELTMRMHKASDGLRYETAKEMRDMIAYIKTTTEKQKMTINPLMNCDILGYVHDEETLSINLLYMRQGNVIASSTKVFDHLGDPDEAVISYLTQHYASDKNAEPQELLIDDRLPLDVLSSYFSFKISVPQKGDKKKLIELSIANAQLDFNNHLRLKHKKEDEKRAALKELTQYLNIASADTIEAFDNSNIMGAHPVSALVVFKNGQPSKKEYRKYKIKSVKGIDDYETMREVVYRRYQRLLVEGKPLPDILLVDGGKGHLSAAQEIITNLNLNLVLIGAQKNVRHQTEALVYQNKTYPLNKRSALYRLIAQIQDEVHRFAISFHRSIRGKTMTKSVLDEIDGIGPARKMKLLKTFKTIEAIVQAPLETITELGIPLTIAQNLQITLRHKLQKRNEEVS